MCQVHVCIYMCREWPCIRPRISIRTIQFLDDSVTVYHWRSAANRKKSARMHTCAEAWHTFRPVAISHFAMARRNEQIINENGLMTISLDIVICGVIYTSSSRLILLQSRMLLYKILVSISCFFKILRYHFKKQDRDRLLRLSHLSYNKEICEHEDWKLIENTSFCESCILY